MTPEDLYGENRLLFLTLIFNIVDKEYICEFSMPRENAQ